MITNCLFSIPVDIEPGSGQTWAYSRLSCTSTDPTATNTDLFFLVQHPTSSAGNFYIEKKFTYGDITLTFFFLVFVAIFGIYLLKKFFWVDQVEIHSIHKKSF
jgi:hypothetical protein